MAKSKRSIADLKKRAEYIRQYRIKHKEKSRYFTSRSNARTFFRKYIKPKDLPEFEKRIAECKKRFAPQNSKSK